MKLVRATLEEQDRLEAEIGRTVPATHAGRRAKAEVAISLLGGGTYATVAKAVLQDFMRADGGAA